MKTETAKPHNEPTWIVCFSPSGCIIYNNNYYDLDYCGVRPFLIFNSSIFGSSEAEQ